MARFPCLQTLAPAAARTSAEIVETLIVPLRSPPVPHVSTSSPSIVNGSALARIERRRPEISSTVSPFVRSPARSAATSTGLASPASTESSAADASEALKSSRRNSRPSTLAHPPTASMVAADPDSAAAAGSADMLPATSVPPEVMVENSAGDEPELHL